MENKNTASQNSPLFACSKCFSRHPFEELSQGQQLCKECRGAFPIVKCTYCRSEFQQESKSSTVAVCKKCESMVKQYGKPSACDFCNVIAAFIGYKCQRCTNSIKKYGPPLSCDQCKQKCAFNRHDEDKKKVDGKLLCWLCTLSYRRALAKTKSTDPARHTHVKLGARASSDIHKLRRVSSHSKKPNRPDVTKMTVEESPTKVARNSLIMRGRDNDNMGDQFTIITQLREQISSLEKQLSIKDLQLLAKDRQITELKAAHFTSEIELRTKMRTAQRAFDVKVGDQMRKIKDQAKEIATLSKGSRTRKNASGITSSTISISSAITNNSGSSGTDSPSTN